MSEGWLRRRRLSGSTRPGVLAALIGLAALAALSPAIVAPAIAATPVSTLVWSTVSPPSSPPALEFASAVYDSDNHTIVLFGGINSQGSVSDTTWVWDGTTWTGYSPAQIEEPPARYLASMSFDPALHQLILFGGRNNAGRQLDDTWAWNGASWYNINPRANSATPSPRDGAALAYDGQGHLLLFGGEGPTLLGGSPTTPLQPSSSQQSSREIATSTTSGAPPTPTVLSDTWEWGTNGWTQVATSGPSPRLSAAAAYDSASGSVLMFGGTSSPMGSSSAGTSQLGDTWTWNGSGWSQASPTSSPPARSVAVLADDPVAGGVVLFGGSSGSGPIADTWVWNGSSWSQISTSGTPGARAGATGAADASSSQLVVFGGAAANGGLLGSTVVLSAGAPLPLGPASSGPTTTVPASQHGSPSSSAALPTTSRGGAATPSAPQRSRALAGGGGSSAAPASNSRPVVHPGQLVTLRGSGFSPNAKVTITFHSTPVTVGETVADSRGDIVATVSVPGRAQAGTHRFEASGLTPHGQSTVVLAIVKVVGLSSSSRPSLVATSVLVGVALLLPLGTWLLLGARGRVRRRVA